MSSTYASCALNTVVGATLLDLEVVYSGSFAGVRVAVHLQISDDRILPSTSTCGSLAAHDRCQRKLLDPPLMVCPGAETLCFPLGSSAETPHASEPRTATRSP